ncbi:hypothetical protein [Halomonas sp. IOP_31]|uniref:hypothetical protein n=1 Tax=Halomonas sp. IOP_31 TaxID=2876584 RepID=UPI001E2F3324|nr:hypothetical protein [Halomonas sp. IOP_31]
MTPQNEAQVGVELREARQAISTLKAQLASSERRNGYLEAENNELHRKVVMMRGIDDRL